MPPPPDDRLPGYRPNVGAVLFNRAGLVLVGERVQLPGAWQLPQGGIDPGEEPLDAVRRELREEIGTDHADILAEHPDWLTYDLPPRAAAQAFGGRYKGQRQKWFALRFLGGDADIRLDSHGEVEFSAWRWMPLADLPAVAVSFKRHIYERLAHDFAHFAIVAE